MGGYDPFIDSDRIFGASVMYLVSAIFKGYDLGVVTGYEGVNQSYVAFQPSPDCCLGFGEQKSFDSTIFALQYHVRHDI
jgi:hypothetical protein